MGIDDTDVLGLISFAIGPAELQLERLALIDRRQQVGSEGTIGTDYGFRSHRRPNPRDGRHEALTELVRMKPSDPVAVLAVDEAQVGLADQSVTAPECVRHRHLALGLREYRRWRHITVTPAAPRLGQGVPCTMISTAQ